MIDSRMAPAVGVVVAMAAEERHLLALATGVEFLSGSVFPVHMMNLGEIPTVVYRSGIGMVHAAAATEAMIVRHQPSIVLNFGCAGAHRRDLEPGDVIIGSRCVYHAASQILPDGSVRYVGFTQEAGSDIAHVNEFDAVPADPRLVDRAIAFAIRNGIEPWPGRAEPPRATVGAIASADVWTQAIDQLDAIHQRHETLCEDMEAAAIGRVAFLHRLPFLAVKDISNNEFMRASDLTDFSDFPVQEVGKRAAAVIAAVVAELGSRDFVCC